MIQVELNSTIADLYRQMGFERKAALFSHFAARWASEIAKSSKDYGKVHAHVSEIHSLKYTIDLLYTLCFTILFYPCYNYCSRHMD